MEIPTESKREYAKILRKMADVAKEEGAEALADELTTAAKKLDGRGRKPASSSDETKTTKKTTKKKAAPKKKKTTKKPEVKVDDTKSDAEPETGDVKTTTEKDAAVVKQGAKTRISIKSRPAEEDELADIVDEEAVENSDDDDTVPFVADSDTETTDEFDEFV